MTLHCKVKTRFTYRYVLWETKKRIDTISPHFPVIWSQQFIVNHLVFFCVWHHVRARKGTILATEIFIELSQVWMPQNFVRFSCWLLILWYLLHYVRKKKPHSPLLLSQEDIISGASIRYICYSLPWCNSNGMLWKWRRSQNTDKNIFTLYTERHSEFPISIAGKYYIQHA